MIEIILIIIVPIIGGLIYGFERVGTVFCWLCEMLKPGKSEEASCEKRFVSNGRSRL